MKKKDILLIVAVVIVSGIAALLFSKLVISSPSNRQEQIEVVDVITSDFNPPDNKYFNSGSIDPTKVIQIGDTDNPKPFTGTN